MIKLNGFEITPTIFPDKTSQVWKLANGFIGGFYTHNITWEFESESEFIHLAQLVDLLRATSSSPIELFVPFMPYARQDKEISNNNTFARSTFYGLLNSLRFSTIMTLDVHSKGGPGPELRNLKSIFPKEYIRNAMRAVGPTVIVFPDAGARNRYYSFYESLEVVVFDKVRNQSTGEIEGLTLGDQVINPSDRVLIVDDICDGGRTFIEASKLLIEKGVSDINLYTTHGIYSKGTQVLRDAGIKRIFNYKGEVK